MKQFLYLDIDIVNSIIAQAEKGLVGEQSSAHVRQDGNIRRGQVGLDVSGEIGGSLLKLAKAEAELSISGELGFERTLGDESREIISKTLHDAAFDIASTYIKPKIYEINQEIHESCGSYIRLIRTFDFIDFDYLEKVLGKNGIVDLGREIEKKNIGANSKQGQAIHFQNIQYDFIRKAVTALRMMIPCARMLASTDGFVVPLDDKYFRVNPENLGFKYGGQITCVGMITNVIGDNSTKPNTNNTFSVLHKQANDALKSFLQVSKECLFVIHPIAVFYGE